MLKSHFSMSFCIRSMTSGGWVITSFANFSSSSPVEGSTSRPLFLTSAKKAGSTISFIKASRKVLSRSAGMPGGSR